MSDNGDSDNSEKVTHGEGCWNWGTAHYECACREVDRYRNAYYDVLKLLESPMSELLLMSGEMTLQEKRTLQAVLGGLRRRALRFV